MTAETRAQARDKIEQMSDVQFGELWAAVETEMWRRIMETPKGERPGFLRAVEGRKTRAAT